MESAQSSGEASPTRPVELLWDLVFVFAVTQVATLLAHHLTWAGFGRSMLVLALVWWGWSAFVWAANALPGEPPQLRLTLLSGALLIAVAGLAIPRAFGSEGLLFACAYAAVRVLHLALYAHAAAGGLASWRAISGIAVTVLIGMGLLIVGATLDGTWRDAMWAGAVLIDYSGPALLTRDRLRGLQDVAVAHFADRYGLFVLICLGESIVAVGIGASSRPLDATLVAAVASGVLITIELWWVYFARFATRAEERLRALTGTDDAVLAAADSYSYLHLVLIAGIIVFAVGIRLAAEDFGAPMHAGPRLALCAGISLYLSGHAAFRLRLAAERAYAQLVAAVLPLVLFLVSADVAAWGVAAILAAILGALCAADTRMQTAAA